MLLILSILLLARRDSENPGDVCVSPEVGMQRLVDRVLSLRQRLEVEGADPPSQLPFVSQSMLGNFSSFSRFYQDEAVVGPDVRKHHRYTANMVNPTPQLNPLFPPAEGTGGGRSSVMSSSGMSGSAASPSSPTSRVSTRQEDLADNMFPMVVAFFLACSLNAFSPPPLFPLLL